MLPSRMMGAASQTNSRKRRQVLRATCRSTGRRKGNISMTKAASSPGIIRLSASQPRTPMTKTMP